MNGFKEICDKWEGEKHKFSKAEVVDAEKYFFYSEGKKAAFKVADNCFQEMGIAEAICKIRSLAACK